jgi:hypothetical protein
MRKSIILLLSLASIIAVTVSLSSCKDDEPVVPPKLSFSVPTLTATESDEVIQVEVVLDKPAGKDITIEYSLDGTATDFSTVGEDEAYDYEILTEQGEIEILQGETSGVIEIDLTSDLFIEDPETIEIKLESVDEGIELTRDDEIEITINQEDGLIVALYWPAPTATAYADMDLIVRVGTSTSSLPEILTGSTQGTNTSPEFIFLPKTINDATFGLSHTYYSGTLDPLNFTVRFIDLVNGNLEPEASREVFTATYTAANKNEWTDPNSTQVVQTFVKSGQSFTSISQITVPASGSRISSPVTLRGILRKGNKMFTNENFLRKLKTR